MTGLTNGTEYRFQVRAVNVNGDGAASPASNPVTPAAASQSRTGSGGAEEQTEEEPAEAPPSPSRPSVSADGGQVTLTWSSRGDGGSRIRRWQYAYRTDGDYGPWTDIPDSRAHTTSFTVTGLTKGATYRFRVRAVNAVGAGAASPDSVAVRIATIPAAPGTPTVSAGHGQVTLTWAPGDDGGSPITRWQYASRAADAYGEWTDIPESGANTTSFTVTGLTNGATYRFKVRGVNAEGAGAASPESTAVTLATTPAAPGKPRGSGGYETVTLSWTAGGDGGAPITGWEYRRASGGGWTEVPGSGARTTSHTVTGLTNGVAYRFQVRAVNALGPGEPSPLSDPVSAVDSEPTFGDARVPDQSYEQGVPIAPLTLPAATGGDGRLTYALAPALPAGLAFNAATRTLTGTPTRPEEAATWTWTATDSDPSDPDSARLSFAIEVAVATADRAIMEDSLAAQGRALLTNATGAIGERFRRGNAGAGRAEDALRAAAGSLGGELRGAVLSAARAAGGDGAPGTATASFTAPGRSAEVSPFATRDTAALSGFLGRDEVLRGRSFAAQLGGGEGRPSRWTAWGAGAAQRFDGSSVAGTFDGQVNSVFGGLDVRLGEDWLAGAAASRSWGESDYDATAMAGSRGRLTTALNGIYPYLRRESPGGLEVWAIGGYGRGEAEDLRDGSSGAEASGLEMRMGAAGLRRKVTDLGGVELSVVGGAGYLLLTTEEGRRAVDGVSAEVSQGRLALEVSRRVGTLAPYVRVGGRFDGGDVATGAGLEVMAGMQYGGERLDFEAQGRWLATHSASGYQEYGGMARLAVRGRPDGGGLRLHLAPRWGAAGMADGMLGGGEHLLGGGAPAAAMLPAGGVAGWSPRDRPLALRGDVGYGFRLSRGVLVPAVAYDRGGYGGPRARFGFAYEAGRAAGAAARNLGFLVGWEPATAAAASDYRMEVRYSRPF